MLVSMNLGAELAWEKIGRWSTAAFCVFLFIILTLVILPSLLDDKLSAGKSSEQWVFWFQTWSGNWTGAKPGDISKWWFAFSAIVAVLLNNSLYLVVLALIWQISADRRKRMKLREALDAFEIAARAELIKRLAASDGDIADTAGKIDQGLAEGRKAALPIIQAVWGQEMAATWESAQDRELS